MPELVPLWERLADMADGDRDVARMLAMYKPTPYVSGCTQAVHAGPPPVMVRNYDYHPHACEGTFARTRWLGTTVLASSDCLWGALDGINEHGLAVALSFGGSRGVGDGFGIPLILRYVLQSCANVADARKVLRRVPCHMAYNVSMVDRSGAYAVAYLRPGADPLILRETVAANHQARIDWPEYVTATRSSERKRFTRAALREVTDEASLVALFLDPPLYVTDYAGWHGTLYTASYRPEEGAADVYWRGGAIHQSIDGFTEREFDVPYYPEGVGLR